MPSDSDLVRLGELVRDAREWWRDRRSNNGVALGEAIQITKEMLRPWLIGHVTAHLGGVTKTGGTKSGGSKAGGTRTARAKNSAAIDAADDILSEVSAQAVSGFPKFDGTTGRKFYDWLHKIAECRMADRERARRARRKRGVETSSLDREADVARLAALLEDDSPSAEAAALLKEHKAELRRARKGLTPGQRDVVNAVMEGLPMSRIVEIYGAASRADWRAAATHIKRVLEGSPRRPRKPK